MAEIVFWVCVLGIGYTYVGYGLLLWVLSKFMSRPPASEDITPPVTIIITAYNEEKSIAAKLHNLLSQDYPREAVQIIVASDASTDATDRIVKSMEAEGIMLVRVEGRLGKTAAQNRAVQASNGEILVFTDATTELHKKGIRRMMRSFADPEVACVGGQLSYVSEKQAGVGSGGSSYWQYERTLKRMESAIHTLIGVSGCFYAVRKSAFSPIPPHLISDFVIALDTVEKGYRVIYEGGAESYEETLEDPQKEYAMRVRVILRTYAALWEKRNLMNPFRYPLFAVQLISHKVLRYAVPLLMLGALVSNGFLLHSRFYIFSFAVQLAFYMTALTGHFMQRSGGGLGFVSKPYYFALANLAALSALLKFLKGQRIVTWEPVRK